MTFPLTQGDCLFMGHGWAKVKKMHALLMLFTLFNIKGGVIYAFLVTFAKISTLKT